MRMFLIIASTFLIFSCDSIKLDNSLAKYVYYEKLDSAILKIDTKKDLSLQEHFMLGNLYKEKKDYKKALSHYIRCAFRFKKADDVKLFADPIYQFLQSYSVKTPLYEEVCYEIADTFSILKEHEYAVKICELVTNKKTSLYMETLKLKSNNLSEIKKFDEAIASLKSAMDIVKGRGLKAFFYIRIASTYEKMASMDKATESYMEVLKLGTDNWQAESAVDRIMAIKKDTSSFNDEDLFLIASALYTAKKYKETMGALLLMKASSQKIDELLVKTYVRLDKVKDAMLLVEKYKTDIAIYNRMRLLMGDVLWFSGRKGESVDIYASLVENVPDMEYPDQLERLTFYYFERSIEKARTYAEKYYKKYPSGAACDNFLWLEAKDFLKKGDTVSAEEKLKIVLERYPSSDFAGNAAFWLYKLSRERNDPDSEKYLVKLFTETPDSSYAWIMAERARNEYTVEKLNSDFAKALDSNDKTRALFCNFLLYSYGAGDTAREKRFQDLSKKGMNPYSEFNSYMMPKEDKARDDVYNLLEIYSACAYGDGIKSIYNLLEDNENVKDMYYYMSVFGEKFGHSFNAYIGTIKELKEMKMPENISLIDPAIVKRLLPEPFLDVVNEESKKYNIDKWKIYSIMKAESAYNHKAMSSVGAAGLMQIMPSTGKGIASALKVGTYNLTTPDISIKFGVHYLSWLDKVHKGDFREIAGGYNAGPGNMLKWKQEYKAKDDDYFAEMIPFEETRGYILRISKYNVQYKAAYRE